MNAHRSTITCAFAVGQAVEVRCGDTWIPAFVIGLAQRGSRIWVAVSLLTNFDECWINARKLLRPCEHPIITDWRDLVANADSLNSDTMTILDDLLDHHPLHLHPCYGDADDAQRIYVLTRWIQHGAESAVVMQDVVPNLIEWIKQIV